MGQAGNDATWAEIADWCRRELGSSPRRRLFGGGHTGNVTGVELGDGRQVVVKLRPPDERVHAVIALQQTMFDMGFPCPEPLTAPSPLGGLLVTAETFVPAGRPPPRPPAPECAERLAALVALTGDPHDFPGLDPAPPWVAWDHGGTGRWPPPDDLELDLNGRDTPSWLDDAADRVRARLAADGWPPVIGHCDWEAHNLGWRNGQIAVVYDWDSLAIRSEPAVAGAAATVFASVPGGRVAAGLDETDDFLDAYRRRRPRWDGDATELAHAAGLWVILYNACKELAGGGAGYLDHVGRELRARLGRAGA
jgi:hypothetical protein